MVPMVVHVYDSIRDSLARAHASRSWDSSKTCGPATVEPQVPSQNGADLPEALGPTQPVGPSAASTRAARPPLDAAEAYAAIIKAAKYADQSNFVPFIVETGAFPPRR
jgi:hypothetical protein